MSRTRSLWRLDTRACVARFGVSNCYRRGDEDKDEASGRRYKWTAAHDATFSSRNERVRAEGLRAIATLCRRRLAKNARGIIESGDADAFIFALSDGAAADKSDETRSAAADALRRSEILAQVSSSTCTTERSIELALTAWTCALTLIEDAMPMSRRRRVRARLSPSRPSLIDIVFTERDTRGRDAVRCLRLRVRRIRRL